MKIWVRIKDEDGAYWDFGAKYANRTVNFAEMLNWDAAPPKVLWEIVGKAILALAMEIESRCANEEACGAKGTNKPT